MGSHRLLLEPGGLDSHPGWESLQKYGRQLPRLTTLRRSRSCLTLCQAVPTSEECQDTRSTAVVSHPGWYQGLSGEGDWQHLPQGWEDHLVQCETGAQCVCQWRASVCQTS